MLKKPIYTPPQCYVVYQEQDAVLCVSAADSDFNNLDFESYAEE